MGEFKYNDILNMKYPNIETEFFFGEAVLREAQFAPFAALTGHDDAIKETARITDKKIELDEYEKEEINRKLVYIKDNIKTSPKVVITYFVQDEKKSGGKYVEITARIKKIREYEKDIVLENNTHILFDNIISVEV